MIDILMALWNRGQRGRGIMVLLAFLLICISISLLLVTAGGLSLFAQDKQRSSTSAVNLIATTQVNNGDPTVGDTPRSMMPTSTSTVNPCMDTPTRGITPTRQASATFQTGGSHPGKPTAIPTHPRPMPTPTVKVTPTIKPSPTPSPTVRATPSPTPSPSATDTPTPGVTPTDTPTDTPTPGVTPTPTMIPPSGVTATANNSPTPGTTSTIGPSIRGGNGITPGTQANDGQNNSVGNTNCLGDSLEKSTDDAIIGIVEHNLWLIPGGSLLGTGLFYGTCYAISRRRK
jgi:outer membrane biosynthesis protein TonB